MEKNLAERGEPYAKKNWNQIRFHLVIISILNIFPRVKKIVVRIWDYIHLSQYQRRAIRLLIKNDNDFDIDKLYWVNPKKIQYASLKEFDVFLYKGNIIGGNWDLLEKSFEDLDVYIAFKERFVEGKKWETTMFYQRTLDEIKQGKFLWNCKNQSDFDIRLKKLELLFKTIKNNGYKSQQKLQSKNNSDPLKLEDEVAINIGRDGDLLFNNGAHRLSIAKLLSIPKIPMKITVRHPQWVNLKKQILLYSNDQPSGKIYQPLTHIDLQDIPAFHETEIDRFEIIRKSLSVKKGRLLDIGANWGFFCHRFEELGFDCIAVENDHVNVYFLEKLKRAENRKFTIIPQSIFDYKNIDTINFDVILALNIFHHFLKTEESYHKLINLLKKLNVKELYFEPHCPEEFYNIIVYKNYSEEEFVQFILDNTTLNHATFIGETQDGRKIFKLSQTEKRSSS
jgi:hypothetical protein